MLVSVSVRGQRSAASGKREAWRETLATSRDPLAAWRQPDTNTSTDTGSLTAPISARVKAGGVLWRHRTGA